jgi:hypothetical protein
VLAEGLGILQGIQQVQTWQVGRQANGYGAKSKWSIARPGTALYVNAATGTLLSAVKDAVQAQQIGSAETPFASLEEALSTLAAPATAEAWATPRPIVLGPGNYTVGAAIIRRSLSFILDAATRITDTVMIESSNTNAHSSTANVLVEFICPTGLGGGRQPCLPGGIQIDRDGVATRLVAVALQGVSGVEVNVGTGVTGGLGLFDAGAELHAPGLTFPIEVRDGTIEGTTLEASEVLAYNANIEPTAITCVGTNECRLYSSRVFADGTWTGGTVLVDSSTDWSLSTEFTWAKVAPGGVVFNPMF